MKALLNNVAFFLLTFIAVAAQAQQSSLELSCRAKAKEIAAQTYSGCVTEARNTQIEQIRKDYQKQLTDLKAKYDRELKKIGGKGIKTTPVTTSLTSRGSAPKATKGIAKTLPTRKEVKSAAPAVVQETSEDKITVVPDSTTPSVEREMPQNEAESDLNIELVPAPASSDQTAASSEEPTY